MDSRMSFAAALTVVAGVADSLDGVFQDSERVFAAIGAGLGDAIVDFGALTATFEALSTSLENEDMREAADRLMHISRAIESMSEALLAEQAALAELLALNRDVADRFGRLQDGARTMSILTLNAKIEATRVNREGEDLSIFSVEMAGTVKVAQKTVDAHGGEQAKLIKELGSACIAQAEFERRHRGKIASISKELTNAIELVDDRRREAAKIAAGMGVRSKQISTAISGAIIALQVGDNARQRIEHVVEALRTTGSIAPSLESEAAAATLRTVCLLEAAQIDAASGGFEDGLRHICEALEQLAGDCMSIGAEGARIFGAETGNDGSFFGVLHEKLDESRQLMQECAVASASVEVAKAAALRTLISLQERMAALDQAVKQMTLVGINAGLKSRKFGSTGLGLGVIAEQLRSNAKQISCDADMLMPSLGRALAIARGLDEQRKSLPGSMEDFGTELSAMLGAFGDMATRLDGALTSLLTKSRRVNGVLGSSIVELAPQHDVCAVLHGAAHDLRQAAHDLPTTTDCAASAALLATIWALYTMEGERVIHRGFAEPGAYCQPTPHSSDAEEELGDILFA